MPKYCYISLRHAVHAGLETKAKKDGKALSTLLNELLEKKLTAAEGHTIQLYEPGGMYTNHGRNVGGIDPDIHRKIKNLALSANSSMMDIASSLLAEELGITGDQMNTVQRRSLTPRDWVVQPVKVSDYRRG